MRLQAVVRTWRELLGNLRRAARARREARLRAFVNAVLDDCQNAQRQAERLARWQRRLNQAGR